MQRFHWETLSGSVHWWMDGHQNVRFLVASRTPLSLPEEPEGLEVHSPVFVARKFCKSVGCMPFGICQPAVTLTPKCSCLVALSWSAWTQLYRLEELEFCQGGELLKPSELSRLWGQGPQKLRDMTINWLSCISGQSQDSENVFKLMVVCNHKQNQGC